MHGPVYNAPCARLRLSPCAKVPAARLEAASLPAPLQSCGYPVNVLDVQYRMHPAISTFPSQEFYQGRLKDGEVSRQGQPVTCS